MRVSTSLYIELSGKVSANGLGRGLEAECGSSGGQIRRVLRLISLLLHGLVLLLWDQVVNAFFVLNHL